MNDNEILKKIISNQQDKFIKNNLEIDETYTEDRVSCISALRVYIYECNRARDVVLKYEPKNCIKSAWFPQTISDSIWVFYEFESNEERVAWESGLPDVMTKWLRRRLIPEIVFCGWNVRNANGFIVEVVVYDS